MKNEIGQGEAASSNNWGRRRSCSSILIIVLCILLLLVCIALAVFGGITYNKLRIAEEEAKSTCHSSVCVEEAAQILENINPSVKPCDNFYEFACGNFIERSVVPPGEKVVSIVQNMEKDIYIDLKKHIEAPISAADSEVIISTKNLYASCMNNTPEEESVEILRAVLVRVGRWPIADSRWNERDTDMERRLAILFVHGVEPFIQGTVDDDDKNETDYLLDISSGSLILKDMHYLNLTNPDHERYILSYKKMIIEAARILGANDSVIQRDIEDMLEFETDYASISLANQKYGGRSLDSNTTNPRDNKRYTVSKLERIIPEIKWGHFLDKIFDYFKLSDQKEDITITLQNKKYFRNLAILLRNTPNRTLANYLTWRFVYKLMPYLDTHFRRLYYDFRREVPGISRDQIKLARWEECLRLVKKALPMPVTSFYVKDNFDEDKKEEVVELIKSIKKGVIGGIKQQKWMDPKARALAEQKVQKMKKAIGFPRFVLKADKLAKEYKGLNISRTDFLSNVLRVNRHKVATKLSKLTGKKEKEIDWMDEPLRINAHYLHTKNQMLFPLGILRNPVFVSGRPKFASYATLGAIVAHEISHGFDTFGFRIDSNGVEKRWWNEETGEKYREKVVCFAEQYSKLTIEKTDQYVNADVTLDDDLSDNSGLRNAYRAYSKYLSEYGEEPRLPGVPYTNSQAFFLKYAQLYCEVFTKEGGEAYVESIHSPGRHRVNVPLSNSPEFSAAFKCALGSPMNPEKKCNLLA